MNTNQNLLKHSIFGCRYAQQCHKICNTSQDFVYPSTYVSTVSLNSQHYLKSRKLFHFRLYVRSTISRILDITQSSVNLLCSAFLVFLFAFGSILSSSLRRPWRNSTLLFTSISSFVSICLDTHVHMPFAVIYNKVRRRERDR